MANNAINYSTSVITRETGTPTTAGTKLFYDEATKQVMEDDDGGARPYIGLAIKDADTLSTYTNEGLFKFVALEEGAYDLIFTPEEESGLNSNSRPVTVRKGVITRIPTITLE